MGRRGLVVSIPQEFGQGSTTNPNISQVHNECRPGGVGGGGGGPRKPSQLAGSGVVAMRVTVKVDLSQGVCAG